MPFPVCRPMIPKMTAILLVVTIVGIASMRSSIMEEKITANLRDKALSLQTANMALREPEGWLNTQINPNLILDENSSELCASSPCSNSIQVWKDLDWTTIAVVANWWGDSSDMSTTYGKDPIIYGTDGSAVNTLINYCGDASKSYKRTYGFDDNADENNCIPQVVWPPTYIVEAFPVGGKSLGVKYNCSLKVDDYFYRNTSKGFGARQTTSSTVRSYYLKKC